MAGLHQRAVADELNATPVYEAGITRRVLVALDIPDEWENADVATWLELAADDGSLRWSSNPTVWRGLPELNADVAEGFLDPETLDDQEAS